LFRRTLSLGLIPLSIATVLLFSPPLNGQGVFTTITSVQYSTQTATSTVYSTIYSTATSTGAIGFLQRPYDYHYSTGSFTLGQDEEILRVRLPQPFARSVEVEHVCLYYDYFVFAAEGSQEFRGHFEASSPVDFYIMTLNQLEFSFYNLLCGNNVELLIHPAVSVTAASYDLDWVAPQTGQYVFLFATHRSYGGQVAITFYPYAYSTSTEASTITNALPSTSTIQAFKMSVLTQSANAPLNHFQTIYPVTLVVMIVIAAGVLFALVRSRKLHH
jgi:hypothetical protein